MFLADFEIIINEGLWYLEVTMFGFISSHFVIFLDRVEWGGGGGGGGGGGDIFS